MAEPSIAQMERRKITRLLKAFLIALLPFGTSVAFAVLLVLCPVATCITMLAVAFFFVVKMIYENGDI